MTTNFAPQVGISACLGRLIIGLILLIETAAATEPPAAPPLPDPVQAGWHGNKVCEVLAENVQVRTARCTFPPGAGHQRHFHAAHWGYVLTPSTMRITTASGTVVRELKAGDSWWSDGVAWHEVLNVGTIAGVYLIVEPKQPPR